MPANELPQAKAFEVHDAKKRFGSQWALGGVSYALPRGRSLLLTGSNGSGKTTLLRLLASAIAPSAGAVRVLGLDPGRDRLALRSQVSLVSHANYLYEDLSAEANLLLVARALGQEAPHERTREVLERVGLSARRASPVRQLSAGMRKRCAIGRLLLKAPQLALLDEPFGELDPQGILHMEALIQELRERGTTIVLATHLIDQGLSLTEERLHLDRGRVAEPSTTPVPPATQPPPLPLPPKPRGFFATVVDLVRKDALLEWRTRTRLNALVFFALAMLLTFSFALGPDTAALRRATGGYLWLGLLFASVLALGESFRVERENNALEGLRLTPVDLRALFLGKALANTLLLWGLALVLTPVAIGLFDAEVQGGVGALAFTLFAGSLGIAAPGTFYAAIAAHARARDVLLPLLLFPMLIPSLLASVKATNLIFFGDPLEELSSWLTLSCVFDVLYWALGLALFPRILEED